MQNQNSYNIPLEDILQYYPEISGVHPACLAVPSMSEVEYADLLADMNAVGLCHPIVLTEDKLLLDGRNRLRACFDAAVEPRFTKTGVDPWVYVNSANIQRRHLTIGQKAMFGQAMLDAERLKAKERQKEHGGTAPGKPKEVENTSGNSTGSEKGDSRDKVAAVLGVSGRSIDKARKIIEYAPELAEKVLSGELNLEPAYRTVKEVQSPSSRGMEKKPIGWYYREDGTTSEELYEELVTSFRVTVDTDGHAHLDVEFFDEPRFSGFCSFLVC